APPAQIKAGTLNVTATTAPPSADIQPGGTITDLQNVDFATLDPMLSSGAASDQYAYFAVFDTLAWDAVDGSIVAQMAESITSTDGKAWTIKLRPNIKFTD